MTARKCPVCGGDSKVYFTREAKNGVILRNRECLGCSTRFQTAETYAKILIARSGAI